MTNEEKELLLIDLGARLHYKVKIKTSKGDGVLWSIDYIPDGAYLGISINGAVQDYFEFQDTKPYLRPMSSMTEEEWSEWHDARHGTCGEDVDFLLSHHFDYRGLIPMGLALEAKEGMYKTE